MQITDIQLMYCCVSSQYSYFCIAKLVVCTFKEDMLLYVNSKCTSYNTLVAKLL